MTSTDMRPRNRKVAQNRTRQRPRWRARARLALSISASLLLLACQHDAGEPQATATLIAAQEALVSGTVYYPSRILMHIGETTTIDSTIIYECRGTGTDARNGSTQRASVQVGGVVTAQLFAAGPGNIQPISSEAQPIVSCRSEGSWSWQLTPARPGKVELSLIVSALQAESGETLFENKRLAIPLEVEGTWTYWTSFFAKQIFDFLSSLLGILGITGAAVIAGAVAYIRKRRGSSEA